MADVLLELLQDLAGCRLLQPGMEVRVFAVHIAHAPVGKAADLLQGLIDQHLYLLVACIAADVVHQLADGGRRAFDVLDEVFAIEQQYAGDVEVEVGAAGRSEDVTDTKCRLLWCQVADVENSMHGYGRNRDGGVLIVRQIRQRTPFAT